MALAYFITFHTYGSWLHGTSKGLGSVDRDHNEIGSEFIEPQEELETERRELMTQDPYLLDEERRNVVRDAIVEICREKNWTLLALHVRSNHMHAVIASDRDASRLMADLKSKSSRALTQAGYENKDRIRWSRHGSTRYLHTHEEVDDKIDYTLFRQGKMMAYYDGRTT